MQILAYLGFALLALVGRFFLREYVAYLDERDAWYSEMLAFLTYAEREVGCFLRTLGEVCDGVGDGLLRASGALPDIAAAHDKTVEGFLSRSLIDRADREELFTFFRSFGMGYHESEMRALSSARERFEGARVRVGAECAKNRRLAPLVYAFAFLALLLLLL